MIKPHTFPNLCIIKGIKKVYSTNLISQKITHFFMQIVLTIKIMQTFQIFFPILKQTIYKKKNMNKISILNTPSPDHDRAVKFKIEFSVKWGCNWQLKAWFYNWNFLWKQIDLYFYRNYFKNIQNENLFA